MTARRKHDVIVVGGGLFGSIAARMAHEEGHRVTLIDDARRFRASPAAGCVIAPNWLASIDKRDYANGLAILDDLYGLHDLEFKLSAKGLKLPGTMSAKRVVTSEVLALPEGIRRINGTVQSVTDKGAVEVTSFAVPAVRRFTGKVLLATGIWGRELDPRLPAIQGLYGASLLVSGQIQQPRLDRYLPYKQAVAFNMDAKQFWFGDGQSVIRSTWDKEGDERVVASVDRMHKLTGVPLTTRSVKTFIGARPYVKGYTGLFSRTTGSNVYVSNGGAKNGTILAALQAKMFLEALR